MKSSIAQRLSKLGVGLESADLMATPEEMPPVDTTTTDVVDTLALTDVQSEVSEAEGVLDRLQEDHGELSEVAAALESFLASADPVSPMVASALAIPARRATQAYGLSNSIPSMESFGTSQEAIRANLRASLEATDSRLKQITTWIKEVFVAMLEKAVQLWNEFTNAFGRMSKKADELAAAASDLGNSKVQITIPGRVVSKLSLGGSYAGDIVAAAKPIMNLIEYHFSEMTPTMVEVSADAVMAMSEMLDAAIKSTDPAAINEEMLEKMKELAKYGYGRQESNFRKAASAVSVMEYSAGQAKTKELLGGVVFAYGIDAEKASTTISIEQLEVDSEDRTIDALDAEAIKTLAEMVSAACQSVIKYHESSPERKKAIAAFDALTKEALSLKEDKAPVGALIRALTNASAQEHKNIQALERPMLNYLNRLGTALLAVCQLSVQAHSKAEANGGLPAPAQA